MLIQTTYKGVHVVGGVKFQSPAHQCGKIEEGDEVVQVRFLLVFGNSTSLSTEFYRVSLFRFSVQLSCFRFLCSSFLRFVFGFDLVFSDFF